MKPLLETNVRGYKRKRGKVRDIYYLRDGMLAIIATDRISAFDVVLGSGIPHKGKVLTAITCFWLKGERFTEIPNHLRSTELEEFPKVFRLPEFSGRIMLCEKLEVLPVEWVIRGYLTGSGWKDYKKTSEICGVKLPSGLKEFHRFEEPILTPATKAETGHDENIPFEKVCEMLGRDLAERAKYWSIHLYKQVHNYCLEKGIIIADTKFEFGIKDNQLYLCDEVLTPDSSRFWPKDSYESGNPLSLDKQFVRDYLEGLCGQGKWNKQEPGPVLPDRIIKETQKRYIEIYRQIVRKPLGD